MKSLVNTNGNSFSSIPSLLNSLFNDDWVESSLTNWKAARASMPAVNVRDTNDDFVIEVAAPGLKRDDFKIELDNNVLTVCSDKEANREKKGRDGEYMRREFSYQAFQRSFSLPEARVEGGKISAKYTDGVLYVTIPKREDAKLKPVRQISVS